MNGHLLVAGAGGVIGRATALGFAEAGWEVSTLSRSASGPGDLRHLQADLLSPDSLQSHAAVLSKVTHLFYAALKPAADPAQEADENAAMFENLVAALRRAGAPLQRVTFVQGGKVYGAHLGVYRTPAREEDSRHFPPNLYFRHEDFARQLQAEAGIPWTALRPDIVIGHSIGSSMNMGNLLGLYGSLCREFGMDMPFPGTARAYRDVLVNICDAGLLGQAALWAAETGADGAYNITNGDQFRWAHVWPVLAEWFGLSPGEPQPVDLGTRLAAAAPAWKGLAEREGLVEPEAGRIAQGGFGDFIFNVETDAVFDVTKARQAGFGRMQLRSDEVLIAHLEEMRRRRLIP